MKEKVVGARQARIAVYIRMFDFIATGLWLFCGWMEILRFGFEGKMTMLDAGSTLLKSENVVQNLAVEKVTLRLCAIPVLTWTAHLNEVCILHT